jgi:hypothetical protein
VVCSVPGWSRRGGAVQGALFEGEVGVQVDLGGGDGFVAQPESEGRSLGLVEIRGWGLTWTDMFGVCR